VRIRGLRQELDAPALPLSGCEPLLARRDHLEHLPPGRAAARNGVLVHSVLECFFDRQLALSAVLSDRQGPIGDDVEGRGGGPGAQLGPAFDIAALAFAEAVGGRWTGAAHAARFRSMNSGVPPVIAVQRSIATST